MAHQGIYGGGAGDLKQPADRAKKRAVTGEPRLSEFDRMDQVVKRKPTVHAMRTELDVTDRRLMAIDDHLATPNHELAREIDALREEK